ncbi:MAG: DUF983 domain-containing protein [Flavobacteriales bacterium]
MFVNETVYTWTNMGEVKEKCDICGANLKPETGFYFGAAYVSWGLTVALWISVLIGLKILNSVGMIEFGFLTHPVTFLSTGLVLTVILFPILLRFSRSLWAHLFIKERS